MKIGILQPGYLPWLGFFEQMHKSEIFVIYDDVQYDKSGWRNRNRIKTPNGIQWLTVPVHVKLEEKPLISQVRIDNTTNWRKKHIFSLRQSYSKAPFYERYINIFEDAYSRNWDFLIDIVMYFVNKLAECLGIDKEKLIMSSTLNVNGDRLERLLKICRTLEADTFYEGISGKNYIDEEYFARNGIKVEYQDYNHPVYKQLYGDFAGYLSVIDLLFNHGPESLSILTNEKVKCKE